VIPVMGPSWVYDYSITSVCIYHVLYICVCARVMFFLYENSWSDWYDWCHDIWYGYMIDRLIYNDIYICGIS
jgi:hypothetical protein